MYEVLNNFRRVSMHLQKFVSIKSCDDKFKIDIKTKKKTERKGKGFGKCSEEKKHKTSTSFYCDYCLREQPTAN